MKHFGAILSCQQFSRNLFIMHGEQRLDSSVFLKNFLYLNLEKHFLLANHVLVLGKSSINVNTPNLFLFWW